MRKFPASLLSACYLWLVVGALQFQAGMSLAEAPADKAHPKAEAMPGAGDAHHPPDRGPITADAQDVDLAIWTLIVFAVFVAVLKKYAWGPMTTGLDKREEGILQNISDAESARIKAEKMLAAHAEKLNKVQDEVREILAEARRDAEYTKNDIVASAQKEADASRQRAIQEIERARDQAVAELFSHMAQAVADATEQVVGRSLTSDDHDRLIREALGDLASRRN